MEEAVSLYFVQQLLLLRQNKGVLHSSSLAILIVALKDYWLHLLKEGEYISKEEFESIWKDCDEIIRILVTIIKTSKAKIEIL